jgi:hypothetical protein
MDADVDEASSLGLRFDALRDDLGPDLVGEGDEGFDEGALTGSLSMPWMRDMSILMNSGRICATEVRPE